jgi:hypothetical protein
MSSVFNRFILVIFGTETTAIQLFLLSKKASNEGFLAPRLWV